MINYFKSAERVLSERGNLDRALSNLERRLERAIVRHGPSDLPAIDYSRPYVSASTTADALSACLEVAEITVACRANCKKLSRKLQKML